MGILVKLNDNAEYSTSGAIETSIYEGLNLNVLTPGAIDKKYEEVITKMQITTNDNNVEIDEKVNAPANPGNISLAEGKVVKVGSTKITVTDTYHMRTKFHRRKDAHSTGIDITTNTGKAVAMSDCTIVDISLQGDGSIIKPENGQAAGYYAVVKNLDGSFAEYMHLDPISGDEAKALKGKKLKRGDSIWGYTIGSGSITDKHVKVRLYGEIPHVTIDPSQYIQGIAYSYIPDAKGNNIIKQLTKGNLLK